MKKLSQKQKLLILVLIVAILVIFFGIINNLPKQDSGVKKIDYGNTNGEKLIATSALNRDNAIYWSLNDIVSKYLNSYISRNEDGSKKKKYKDNGEYYKVLTENYKKHLSLIKYNEVSKTFCEKFLVGGEVSTSNNSLDKMGDIAYVDTNRILKNVYTFDTNRYICKLYSNTTKQSGYIGIELDPGKSEWHIFYIE